MEMTEREICREYRLAKNKKLQIQILADENCAKQEEIIEILKRGREELKNAKTCSRRSWSRKKKDAECGLIMEMERLDREIAKLEKHYIEIAKKIKELR